MTVDATRRERLLVGLPAGILLILAGWGCQPEQTPKTTQEGSPSGEAWFAETSTAAGLEFRYESGHDGKSFLFPEIMGGGVAILDVDEDGYQDIYLVQGGDLRDGSGSPGNQLFVNDGEGGFENRTMASGSDDSGYGMGVTVGDYDGDGDIDLYVTNLGPNVLLQNDGGGRFSDVSAAAGVDDPGWGASAAFFDYDRDGDLDLFVANYVRWSLDSELDCFDKSGSADYCSPVSYNQSAPDVLYRNRGEGRFEDVSAESGIRTEFGNGLGVSVIDFDDDGFLDLFVANDQTPNQLWHNKQGLGFEDVAVLTGCAVSQMGQAKAGMGVDVADVDGDLDLDLLVVNLHAQTDSFFRNQGEYFLEETALVGLGSITRPFTRFGVGLQDFDNDGWLDLYQANGRVTLPERQSHPSSDPFAEPNVLLRGLAPGRFEAVEPAGGTEESLIHTSRAAAFSDLGNDGGIDVVVVNRDAPAYLLSNRVAGKGNWVGLEVLNRQGAPALGARVLVETPTRTVRRDVRVAYSYQAAHDSRIRVGLGEETAIAAVTVRWPDGEEQSFGSQPINRYSELRRSR